MKLYIKENKIRPQERIIVIKDDKQIINPSEELILADGWVEYIAPTHTPTYEEQVRELIHSKYSIDDEIALIRQRDTKPTEFEEYSTFCEDCKLEAKKRAKMI